MNSTLDAVRLLNNIAALGLEVLQRGSVGDLSDRANRCRALDAELETAIGAGGALAARFFDGFAPILLQSIGNAISKRIGNDERQATRWEILIGSLVPQVRDDAGRALEWLAEVSQSERATR